MADSYYINDTTHDFSEDIAGLPTVSSSSQLPTTGVRVGDHYITSDTWRKWAVVTVEGFPLDTTDDDPDNWVYASETTWEDVGEVVPPTNVGTSVKTKGLEVSSTVGSGIDGKIKIDPWHVQINGSGKWSWWLSGTEYTDIDYLKTQSDAVAAALAAGGGGGGGGGGATLLTDAPSDDIIYGRRNATWIPISTEGAIIVVTGDIDLTTSSVQDIGNITANAEILRTIIKINTASDTGTLVSIGDGVNGSSSYMTSEENDPEYPAIFISENILSVGAANVMAQATVSNPGSVGSATAFIYTRDPG